MSIYISIATYKDRFNIIGATLESLLNQVNAPPFITEIHVGENDMKYLNGTILESYVKRFPKLFRINPMIDLGPYKKWESAFLHRDGIILTGSDRITYTPEFVRTHVDYILKYPNDVLNGSVYASRLDIDGVHNYSKPKLEVPGLFMLGLGSTFRANILDGASLKERMNTRWAYSTKCNNDDTYFHMILGANGIRNRMIPSCRDKWNNEVPRLGDKGYEWKKLFHSLRKDFPTLFNNYLNNTRNFYLTYEPKWEPPQDIFAFRG